MRVAEIRNFVVVGVMALGIGLGVTAVLAGRPSATHAPAASQVRLSPDQSQVEFGKIFTLSLQVDAPANLAAYQLDLVYNPQVVEVVTVTLGPALGSTGRTAAPLGPKPRAPGRTTIAAYSYGHAPGVSQSGTLAQIQWRAAGAGNTSIALESLQLVDPQANPLAGEGVGANVAVPAAHSVYLPIIRRSR